MFNLLFFEVASETKIVLYFVLKRKLKRNYPKSFKLFFRSKTVLAIFGNVFFKQTLISNFYFFIVLLCIKKVCASFQKQILVFKVPVIFQK